LQNPFRKIAKPIKDVYSVKKKNSRFCDEEFRLIMGVEVFSHAGAQSMVHQIDKACQQMDVCYVGHPEQQPPGCKCP
jgi:hypothetical protein